MRNAEVYKAIAELQASGGRGVVATVTAIRGSSPASLGAKMLIVDGQSRAVGTVGGGCVDGQVWTAARQVMASGLPRKLEIDLTDRDDDPDHGLICGGLVTLFLEPLLTERLIICGAGHIGQALAEFAHNLNFSLIVLDDRESFANPSRFPKAQLRVGDFTEQLAKLSVHPTDSIVIVTRGHRYDEACLRWAVKQEPRYLGLIGSKVKISKLYQRLLDDGIAPDRLKAVRAPIGLDIGAVTVEEIALSVAAELIAFRRLGSDLGRELSTTRPIAASLSSALKQSPARDEG